MNAKSLPVLMHHYISAHANAIAVPADVFEEQCRALAEAGWHGVGLAEAETYFLHGEPLPAKSCLITFDDGYLDNYVHAWPILKKYRHKGVVFVVAERLGKDTALRPTLEDSWNGNIARQELPDVDNPFVQRPEGYTVREDAFINWAEARHMEASGVVAIASHSFTHQGVPTGETYSGFFLPEKRLRTFDRPNPFFWGCPKFTMKAGLANRSFVINPELANRIQELVPQEEAKAFAFANDSAGMQALEALAASFKGNMGRMETDEEMTTRMREELSKGKIILEEGLGHATSTLCWPWGEYNATSLALAQELGFSVFITTASGPNPPGSPLDVHRFKVRAKNGLWLRSRVWLYSHPILASFYSRMRL